MQTCCQKPEELKWTRFGAGLETPCVQLFPVMPDRAVVVRPESPVKLLQ